MVMEWLVLEGLISGHVYGRYIYIYYVNAIVNPDVPVNEHVNANLTLNVNVCMYIIYII